MLRLRVRGLLVGVRSAVGQAPLQEGLKLIAAALGVSSLLVAVAFAQVRGAAAPPSPRRRRPAASPAPAAAPAPASDPASPTFVAASHQRQACPAGVSESGRHAPGPALGGVRKHIMLCFGLLPLGTALVRLGQGFPSSAANC